MSVLTSEKRRRQTDRPILFSAPMVRALLDGRKTQTRRLLKPPPLVGWDHQGINIHGDGVFYPRGDDDKKNEAAYENWDGIAKLKYQIGDRLWVQEEWKVVRGTLDYETGNEYDCFEWDHDIYGDPRDYLSADARANFSADLYYSADGEDENPCVFYPGAFGEPEIAWSAPSDMPIWASRLTLVVTDVRVQRLQDISEADAIEEGAAYEGSSECGSAGGYDGPSKTHWTAKSWFCDIWTSINGPGAWDANPWVTAVSFTLHQVNIDRMGA